MIKIKNIKELHGKEEENYKFSVVESTEKNIVVIENKKKK